MYVGEGPILPAALARHSSSSCIQSSRVLPKLKFQPSYFVISYCIYLSLILKKANSGESLEISK